MRRLARDRPRHNRGRPEPAVSRLARILTQERLRPGALPPVSWYGPVNGSTGPAFRSANELFYRHIYTLSPQASMSDMADRINAAILRQLDNETIVGITAWPEAHQTTLVALLPGLWSLHTDGPRKRYNLWPALPVVEAHGRTSAPEQVLIALLALPAARAPDVLYRYAALAQENGPGQGRLFGAPPAAEDLFAEARALR